jgi:hypothetical protein
MMSRPEFGIQTKHSQSLVGVHGKGMGGRGYEDDGVQVEHSGWISRPPLPYLPVDNSSPPHKPEAGSQLSMRRHGHGGMELLASVTPEDDDSQKP